MTPACSIAIMAHPDRWEWVEDMVLRLDRDVAVCWDEWKEGAWPTARRAWMTADTDARYHLVLQDDAVLCDQFEHRLKELLEGERNAAFSLYHGKSTGLVSSAVRAHKSGKSFVVHRRMFWGVGICLPVHRIQSMLNWTEKMDVPETWGEHRSDTRVGKYLQQEGVEIRYPIPSLVDHRMGRSLVRKYRCKPSQRTAWWFVDGPKPRSVIR